MQSNLLTTLSVKDLKRAVAIRERIDGLQRDLDRITGAQSRTRAEGCSPPEERQDERGSQSQNLGGNEGPVGEEKGKTACVHARSGQSNSADSARSIEGTDCPNAEDGREVRRNSKGPGGETRKELRQHQCLVPHHGEGYKRNQKGRTWQIRLGVLTDFFGQWKWCDRAACRDRAVPRAWWFPR